jgi:hypothetical protein
MCFTKIHKRNPRWDPSKGRPPQNGQKLRILLKIFDLGRPLIRIRPLKKSLYFSIGKVTHHNETNIVKTKLQVFH